MPGYRCQKCSARRELVCEATQIESCCSVCGDDTKWIADEFASNDPDVLFASPDDSAFTMDSKVKLLVEGKLFKTSVAALLRHDGDISLFHVLFNNHFRLDVQEGAIVIYRPAKWFPWILDYCRLGGLPEVRHLGTAELTELKEESEYYCLRGLTAMLQERLCGLQEEAEEEFTQAVDEILLQQSGVTQRLRQLHDSSGALYAAGNTTSETLRESSLYLIHALEASLSEAKRLLHTDPLSPTRVTEPRRAFHVEPGGPA